MAHKTHWRAVKVRHGGIGPIAQLKKDLEALNLTLGFDTGTYNHVSPKGLPREGLPRFGFLACLMLVQVFCVFHDV